MKHYCAEPSMQLPAYKMCLVMNQQKHEIEQYQHALLAKC